MTIIGIFIGVAIVAGLILAMGKMSEQGVDINNHFCCGSCNDCSNETTGESCVNFTDLEKLHLQGGRNGES